MIGDAMDEAAIQKCMQGKPLSNAAPMQFFLSLHFHERLSNLTFRGLAPLYESES